MAEAKVIIEKFRGGDFYGTGIENWAGFGPVDSTEKRNLGRLCATFEAGFFMFSRAKNKKKIKHCSVCTKKLHKMKFKKEKKYLKVYWLRNISVLLY